MRSGLRFVTISVDVSGKRRERATSRSEQAPRRSALGDGLACESPVSPISIPLALGRALTGVLAHEITHIAKHDVELMQLAGTRRIDDLFSVKAEELSLFGPAGRQPRRQTHQCLGGELRRFSAIDDGRGDVGRQPGKTQEGIGVGCRNLLTRVAEAAGTQRGAGLPGLRARCRLDCRSGSVVRSEVARPTSSLNNAMSSWLGGERQAPFLNRRKP
jgi:hypothetical protein